MPSENNSVEKGLSLILKLLQISCLVFRSGHSTSSWDQAPEDGGQAADGKERSRGERGRTRMHTFIILICAS